MRDEMLGRAATIEAEYGPDITEALNRWQDDGGDRDRERSSIWVSVAFLFSRRLRNRHRPHGR